MSAEFNSMLNEHLSFDLLNEELKKKNYLWKTLEHDNEVSGDIVVPFTASRASSVKAGTGPTAIADIAKHGYTRGTIAFDNIPRTWGSLIFNYEDILNHKGRVKQKSFLGKFLPDQVEDFTTYMAEELTHQTLNKAEKDVATATGTAGGVLEVGRVERYEVGEKLILDPAGANLTAYVTAIDMNADTITVSATRGGAGLDVSGVASGEFIYKDGRQTGANQMTSIREALLSADNGGSTNLYGVSKLASKYTQAINVDGSSITATNILDQIFDGVVTYKRKAKLGNIEILCSLKHLGSIMKQLEQDKGPDKMVEGSMKVSEYGFTEIMLFGPKTGPIKVVGVQELDDDIILGIDPKSMKFQSVKGIQKVTSPEGLVYYTSRDATSGYDFVCDMYYRGDLTVFKPCKNLIWYGVDY
jgi:hypothetical protein